MAKGIAVGWVLSSAIDAFSRKRQAKRAEAEQAAQRAHALEMQRAKTPVNYVLPAAILGVGLFAVALLAGR